MSAKRKTAIVAALVVVLVTISVLISQEEPPQGVQDVTKINTAGWEDCPHISPDGTKLYFMYSPYGMAEFLKGDRVMVGPQRPGHHSHPAWAKFTMDADIYMAIKQEGGTWSQPISLPFNTFLDENSPMPSYDENEFYFVMGINIQGINIPEGEEDYWDWEIYVSRKDGRGNWTKPLNIGAPVNTKSVGEGGFGYSESNPHISEDGKILYFEADHPYDGTQYYGGFDLYYSVKNPDGSWSQPVNMGPNVNTPYDEMQVWVGVDAFTSKLTAFFNRFIKEDVNKWWFLGGIKDVQIFKTDFSSGQWTKAQQLHLGDDISGELSMTKDGKFLYFLSGANNLDIWYSERQPDGSWGQPKPVD